MNPLPSSRPAPPRAVEPRTPSESRRASPFPRIDWRPLAVYAAVLALCWFAVLIYENQRIIARQKREISSLQALLRSLESEQRELAFVRRSLLAREPYFYIKSLREDWGFRRRGETDVLSLPVRRHIAGGVPVYRLAESSAGRSRSEASALLVLFAAATFAALLFLMLLSMLGRPRRSDPVEEMKRILDSAPSPPSPA